MPENQSFDLTKPFQDVKVLLRTFVDPGEEPSHKPFRSAWVRARRKYKIATSLLAVIEQQEKALADNGASSLGVHGNVLDIVINLALAYLDGDIQLKK